MILTHCVVHIVMYRTTGFIVNLLHNCCLPMHVHVEIKTTYVYYIQPLYYNKPYQYCGHVYYTPVYNITIIIDTVNLHALSNRMLDPLWIVNPKTILWIQILWSPGLGMACAAYCIICAYKRDDRSLPKADPIPS